MQDMAAVKASEMFGVRAYPQHLAGRSMACRRLAIELTITTQAAKGGHQDEYARGDNGNWQRKA